ncbi:MAG: pyruvate synthase [Gammaproteobacteria bacterium]|mgnify:CR=1 FL=1|nr:pyruvate synthase [Gammaproteobacteria bacterium]|tara:strand:- start:2845 stop:3840 length:996 start_codon:yes stop_codon:yes gene_type:complete
MAVIDKQELEKKEKLYTTVHDVPGEEFYSSGHRTCEGCESALVMRQFVKAAGPRTIATGSTGCMYVANTSYMTTPWVIPWMHTQLGAGGSSAIGTGMALRALMRKGKLKDEKINNISFCGDLGGADMGIGGISAALQSTYDLLIILYDNESAANTDIQATGSTTWGAQTTFTPTGTKNRVMQNRWKKNTAAMLAVGHPNAKYIATACATFPALDFMNKVGKALAIGGPTFIHSIDPCPKGWDYHPRYSHEVGEAAVKSGIFPLYEVTNGSIKYTYDARKNRIPVSEYLGKQGRFSHFTSKETNFVQEMVDEMWEEWELPGILPIKNGLRLP